MPSPMKKQRTGGAEDIGCLIKEFNKKVRSPKSQKHHAEALDALLAFGPKAVPQLAALLADDDIAQQDAEQIVTSLRSLEDNSVGEAALEALAKLAGPHGGANDCLRASAAAAVVEIAGDTGLLTALLQDEDHAKVRLAIDVICELREDAAKSFVPMLPEIRKHVVGHDSAAVSAAVAIFNVSGDTSPATNILRKSNDAAVEAVHLLGKNLGTRAIPFLMEFEQRFGSGHNQVVNDALKKIRGQSCRK